MRKKETSAVLMLTGLIFMIVACVFACLSFGEITQHMNKQYTETKELIEMFSYVVGAIISVIISYGALLIELFKSVGYLEKRYDKRKN